MAETHEGESGAVVLGLMSNADWQGPDLGEPGVACTTLLGILF